MTRYEVARRRVFIEDYGRPLAWSTIRPYLIGRFYQPFINRFLRFYRFRPFSTFTSVQLAT